MTSLWVILQEYQSKTRTAGQLQLAGEEFNQQCCVRVGNGLRYACASRGKNILVSYVLRRPLPVVLIAGI